VTSGGLSIDQNIYYADDLVMKLRHQQLGNKATVQNKRSKQITFYFSTASFSLHSTAEYILEAAYALLQLTQKNPKLLHITVVHFGAIDTASAFAKHLLFKNNSTTMQKLKFLQESKQFSFFAGNDLKYGNLLRKTHAFIDVTHGHFSEQRVLEAIACGALVMTSSSRMEELYKDEKSEIGFGFVDQFENVQDTIAGIAKMLDCDGVIYDGIMSRQMDIVKEYKLEPRAARWAVSINKQLIAYRANHS
jgi:hypothetical protein